MQKYWWPSYAEHLLRALQRQQNTSQFCDTLLQSEGISVPAHGCILAALSPLLCERLSGSLSSALGQRRKVRLDSITAQSLLKLVGLLYSGEMEVKGSLEKDEVLHAARQFGITDLVEGQKAAWVEERAAQLYHGHFDYGKTAADCPTPRVSVGTQTVVAEEDIADVPLGGSPQNLPPPTVPSSPSGAPVAGDSDSVPSTAVVVSDPDSEDPVCCQQLTGPEEALTGSATPPSQTGRAEKKREEDQAQTLATTKASFKLKLVRTEGKAWEVLNGEGALEMSALASPRPRCHENNLLETMALTNVAQDGPTCMETSRPLPGLQLHGSVSEGGADKKVCGKRKRVNPEEEEVPLKKKGAADGDGVTDKSDRIPPGAKPDGPTQNQAVNVKDIQKVLKGIPSRTRTLQARRNKDTTEHAKNLESEETSNGVLKGPERDVMEPGMGSRKSPLTSDGVDRNRHYILKSIKLREIKLTKENTNTSAEGDVPSAGGPQGPSIRCVHRRRGQTDGDQEPEPLHNSGGSPQLSDKVLSPSDTSASHTHHQSSSQTPNNNISALNSSCRQEEDEEQEEELDILHYSPMPQPILSGSEQVNIDVFPDEEEEEEDEPEIDVTGDEAE